jgi:hypothetical protein
VLEQLETIASDQDRLLPVATWLIVVAANDPLLLRELQQRFSSSTLVRVIGDRRIGASPPDPSIASPNDRRTLASSQEKDHGSYGFFVVHRPDGDTP